MQCQTSTPQQCVHHNRIPPKVEYIELNRLLSTATQTSSRLDPHTKLFRVQRETASRCSKVGSRHKCRNNQMHATCFSPARPGKLRQRPRKFKTHVLQYCSVLNTNCRVTHHRQCLNNTHSCHNVCTTKGSLGGRQQRWQD